MTTNKLQKNNTKLSSNSSWKEIASKIKSLKSTKDYGVVTINALKRDK